MRKLITTIAVLATLISCNKIKTDCGCQANLYGSENIGQNEWTEEINELIYENVGVEYDYVTYTLGIPNANTLDYFISVTPNESYTCKDDGNVLARIDQVSITSSTNLPHPIYEGFHMGLAHTHEYSREYEVRVECK